MLRNLPRIVEEFVPDTLRPVFEENELVHAIWIELVPHRVRLAVVEPGVGPTPRVGDFVRAKQFVYLL